MEKDKLKKLVEEARLKKQAEADKKEMEDLLKEAKELGIEIPETKEGQGSTEEVKTEKVETGKVETESGKAKKSTGEDLSEKEKAFAESLSKLTEQINSSLKTEQVEEKETKINL